MKKLMMLTAVAVVVLTSGAYAEEGQPAHESHGGPGHRGEKMFERLDADKDGKVTKEEFLKVQEEHFAKMDANGDGAFTPEEAKAMREKMKEMMEKRREMKHEGAPSDAPAAAPTETPAEKPAE